MWPSRIRSSVLLAVALIGCLGGWLYFAPERTLRTTQLKFSYADISDGACDDQTAKATSSQPYVIPNVVHYVWLLQNPGELRLSFKAFVSMYSAHLYWNPKRIYIHTNASPETVQRVKDYGDAWTRRVLSMPGVLVNHVTSPLYTRQGVDIVSIEHKSDFVRLSVLKQFGGVYLDLDAVPLRDIYDLRHSGFANVIGGQTSLSPEFSGAMNNGVLMAIPNSKFVKIYHDASDEFFDGIWATASVHLLTDLAKRLVSVPSEVLILHGSAFTPVSFEFEDANRLFSPDQPPHGNSSDVDGANEPRAKVDLSTCAETLNWLKGQELGPGRDYSRAGLRVKDRDPWDLDLSGAYVLHAFDNDAARIKGWDGKITLEYVLARQSHYARAVYPAIRHAIDNGVILRGEFFDRFGPG